MIAITGGIATGKSRVAVHLCALSNAGHIDVDAVCRQLLVPGEAGWQAVRESFGERFFTSDQQLDRPLLRRAIFADTALREQLNALLHPLARTEVARQAETLLAEKKSARLVVEVPLLFEAGWQGDFARVVVVAADTAQCILRLMRRDSVSREDAVSAIRAQMPLVEKMRRADHVVDNSGEWRDTCRQLEALHPLLWVGG